MAADYRRQLYYAQVCVMAALWHDHDERCLMENASLSIALRHDAIYVNCE